MLPFVLYPRHELLEAGLAAELLGVWILRVTFEVLGGHSWSLLSAVAKGYQGMGTIVNCERN